LGFFMARKTIKKEKNSPLKGSPFVFKQRGETNFPPSPDLLARETRCFFTEIFFRNRPEWKVLAFESPDTRAIIACYEFKNKQLVFTPGRRHLGNERKIDTRWGLHQIMKHSFFQAAIKKVSGSEIIIVPVLGEGIVFDLGYNFYLATQKEPGNTIIVSASHKPNSQGHKGLSSHLNYYRAEGKERFRKIRLAIIGDSIAGGRNLRVVLEKLFIDFPHLEKIIILSIHATLTGIQRIAEKLPSSVSFTVFTFNAPLYANPENDYDCFWPSDHQQQTIPDPRDTELLKAIYGPKAYKRLCIAGDFASCFLTPFQANQVTDNQLRKLGLKAREISVTPITFEFLKEIGFKPEELLPASTVLKLKKAGINSLAQVDQLVF